MKALIAGGGICGPATAMALHRAGIDAVVYETHDSLTAGGSYLTVATNGLDALGAIGAEPAILDAGFPTPWTVLASGTGKRLARLPISSTRPERPVSRTIRRADLHRALHDEARRRGVPVEHGKRLVRAESTASGVCAHFEDGSRAVGDILIGCDGVHSVTRTLIDTKAPAPRYVGLLNFGGYAPGLSFGEPGTWEMIFGAKAFFGFVPDPSGGTVWFANVPRTASTRAERSATAEDEWRARLIDLFARDRGPASALIAASRLELIADNTHDLPSVPRWHRDRFIILGDAAHAPSPSSGQGASMALEDAVVLGQCLRDVSSIDAAFAAFERRRRTRVERIVAQGARSSSSKAAGPIARVLRDWMLPLVFQFVVTEQSQAWVYEHHIDWNHLVRADADAA